MEAMMSGAYEVLESVAGIQFVDHVAITVKQGELEGQVKPYEMMGFREVHREEVRGTDQVRGKLCCRSGRVRISFSCLSP
jgi:4-hydroxyphenylpyruvate dioxygenase-like putative hemolysin